MCDCFHLAFPNWHGPAAGPGRRLRGPEQDTEDDSVFEEPEILEGERPRPQGSSPVEEFPAEKQVEEDIYDSPHKGGSSKKVRRVGFGSLFEKRSTAKMSEDTQSGESGVIVKTVKEACAEGLVFTGGGQGGIFIKEVKPDSPASKQLSMQEGDQILSATVYFDNVSYEDALQILQHAQPYKMEFCLRRKVESTMPEDAEIIHPEGKEEGSPEIRVQRKMKKQQDRISWPKFPSFGKGRRAQFKRSHSTSEAEEHRKLEMSPPTSDNESPLKSPLRFPDGKDQKKKQKMQVNVKMKGYRSKSVEEPQRKGKELATENLAGWENQQTDILEENFPEEATAKLVDTAHVMDETEIEVSSKSKQDHVIPCSSEMELQHRVHFISLGNTLKTTDISAAFAEDSAGIMRTSEEGTVERSELKVGIHQKEKTDAGTVSQSGENRISDISASDSVVVSPVVIMQAQSETLQLTTDINTQVDNKHSSEKGLLSINTEMNVPKLDDSEEFSKVGEVKKSQRTDSEKQLKERNIFENESYGIRIRGPLADMATTKTHFASTINGFQFLLPESSEEKQESTISDTQKPSFALHDIFQVKPKSDNVVSAIDMNDLETKISKLPTKTNTDHLQADVDKRSESNFKLPNVDLPKFATRDPIKMTKVEQIKMSLPKREDIEIPGIEDKESKSCLKTPLIKVPHIEKVAYVTKEGKIQAQQTNEEFSVEDVKEAVSKFPAFKLPEGDVTGVLVQREVTIMELKGDKANISPRGSPRKISVTSTDTSTTVPKSQIDKEKSSASDIANKDTGIKIPKIEQLYDVEHTTSVTKTDYTKPKVRVPKTKTDIMPITDDEKIGDATFKLPKREDIEIPGMEAIKKSNIQKTKLKADKDEQSVYETISEKTQTKKYGDQEKKSQKTKISMPSFGITKPDIRFPDIGTDLPKKEAHKKDIGEIKTEKIEWDVPHTDTNLKDIALPGDPDFKLHTVETTSTMSETKFGKQGTDIAIQEQSGMGKSLPNKKGPDLDKEAQSINVDEKTQNIETGGQGSKFKLPKFEISFPEVKVPKMHFTPSKKDMEISTAEGNTDMPPDVEMSDAKTKIKEDIPEVDSKGHEVKTKRSSFSFPRFGFSKSDTKFTEADIGLQNAEGSFPKGKTDMEVANTEITHSVDYTKQEDDPKFGSPTKFKLPSLSFPKFGTKAPKATVDGVDGPGISVPQTEVRMSDEPLSDDIKRPDADKKGKPLMVDMKVQDMKTEGQESKFKMPKFEISLPEVRGPKTDLHAGKIETDTSAPQGKRKVHVSDVEVPDVKTEVKSIIPKVDSKGQEAEMKKPLLSFPRFGFSKSETHTSEADVSVPQVDLSLPGENVKMEGPNADTLFSVSNTGQEDETKFKLPSISLPKFGIKTPKDATDISAMDEQIKGPEINLSEVEVKESAEPLSTDKKRPEINKVEMKAQGMKIDGHESKFKLPKFGIIPLDAKGQKIDLQKDKADTDISLSMGKGDVHASNVKITDEKIDVKIDLLEVHHKGPEVKMDKPGFSFSRFGFSKSETKAPEGDMSMPHADVSLPGENVKIEGPSTEITRSTCDTRQDDERKFDSPKFKLPSISLPKFGAKAPKEINISAIDVQIKDPEIRLPQTEVVVSREPFSVDIKATEVNKEGKSLDVILKSEDMKTEGQESKFKMPKLGIGLPEVQEPQINAQAVKTEHDISVPRGKGEVNSCDVEVPDIKTEVKLDLPKVDSKGFEMKKPGLSLPKIGFSKSETKGSEADVSLPQGDVSLPREKVKIEGPNTDINLSIDDTGQEETLKFGSSTKFKLPTISLPKFGSKAVKDSVDMSAVDVQLKGPEIGLQQAEVRVPADSTGVDIKGPDIDKQSKSMKADMKVPDIQNEGQDSKFKFPKFGINFPEVKGPKIDLHSGKTETDISLLKEKREIHDADVEVTDVKTEVKLDLPKVDSKGFEMKKPGLSMPKIGFSKSETKASEADVSLPQVDVSLPREKVKIEGPNTDINLSTGDTGEEDKLKFGSSTKFKLPTISLPKFGSKAVKDSVDMSAVDVQLKGPEIGLPQAEIRVPSDSIAVDIKRPDIDKQVKSLKDDMKAPDIQNEGQDSKFKFPKFGINFPEVKGPKIDLHSGKTETDISLPKEKGEIHDVEVADVKAEVKLDLPKVDSKGYEMKKLGLSMPKIGFSKSETKASEADVSLPQVDVSLPREKVKIEGPNTDINLSTGDTGEEDKLKLGSSTKFKLPTISLPKFGSKAVKDSVDISAVDVQMKGPEISLPQAEIRVPSDSIAVDIKGPDIDKQVKSLKDDMKAPDIQNEGQDSKFKFPKFGINFPEVKGPKIDLHSGKTATDISLPKEKRDIHDTDVEVADVKTEVKLDLPKVDSKGFEMKKPGLSMPKIGFSKSEIKASEADVSLPQVDVTLSREKIKIEGPNTDINLSTGDTGEEDKLKFGSSTKFKLPTISLPKFGSKAVKDSVDISAVDVQMKGPEISLPQAEIRVPSDSIAVDIQGPDIDKQVKSLKDDMKAPDIQNEGQDSKFKFPKFGINFPEVKGPKIDLHSGKTETEISLRKEKREIHDADVEVADVKTEVKLDLPKVDSKGFEMKKPGLSMPKIGFSKSETKAYEADVSLPQVDVSLPKEKLQIEGPNTDINFSTGDTGEEDKLKFGSPTKFKLPTVSLPKFGSKVVKDSVDISAVDVQMKGPEISLPQAEVKVPADPLVGDIKEPDIDKQGKSLTVDFKAQNIHIEGKDAKFKLPKFGISFPEVKGPKIDFHAGKTETDISLLEGKREIHDPDVEMPDVKTEVKSDLPKVDSKGFEVEMKKPGLSMPKIGFSKSKTKESEADVNLPQVDVSLPREKVKIEGPNTDINLTTGDTGEEDKMKFGSPTKFKLSTVSLPKFGAKAAKDSVDISAVDLQMKGPEISLPQAKVKVPADPLVGDIKEPDIDKQGTSLTVDLKAQNIHIEGKDAKFKLPKFGISFPEVKGPKLDFHAGKTETDISLLEGKREIHAPDVEMPDVKTEVKSDLPKVDSKGFEVEMKKPGLSMPNIGFPKSKTKESEADVNLPQVDVSLPREKVKIEGPNTDVPDVKTKAKIDFPDVDSKNLEVKIKRTGFSFPKFGISKSESKTPEADMSFPHDDFFLPEENVKIEGPNTDITTSIGDTGKIDETKFGSPTKFKLPSISLPKFGAKASKDISAEDVQIKSSEIHLRHEEEIISAQPRTVNIKAPEVRKEGEHLNIDVKAEDMKTEGQESKFKLPKFGISLPEVKGPKIDLHASKTVTDISAAGGKGDVQAPDAEVPDVTTEVKTSLQKVDSKELEVEMKKPSFSFPRFGFSKSETKASKAPKDTADISLPVDPIAVDIKESDIDNQRKSLKDDMKAPDIQNEGQESKFKLPKFGISFPEIKGPKIDLHLGKTETDISLLGGKREIHGPDVKVLDIKTKENIDLPNVDSVDLEMKVPDFSIPMAGFSKSDTKASEADVSVPNVDVSLPQEVLKTEGVNKDFTLSMGDGKQADETKFGSSTKFKLPSISLPKFGAKVPKEEVDISTIDAPNKGTEISLQRTEVGVSAEPFSVDIKVPDLDIEGKSLSITKKAQDIQMEGQESKIKLPKFGIRPIEVKGPKIDLRTGKTDMSLPEGQAHAPDDEVPGVKSEMEVNVPEEVSKGLEVKMKKPGFSFPRFGLSKTETKAPKADVSLPHVDVSLPGENLKTEEPNTDITLSMGDTGKEDKTKFGSPTKFKLPSISLPKFGAKATKQAAEITAMEGQTKGTEISLPEVGIQVSAEPISVDIKGSDIDKDGKSLKIDMKPQDIQTDGQEKKFKLPKFEISIPDVKKTKIDLHASKTETDISVPEGKGDMHAPDVDIPNVKTEVKVHLSEVDSKDTDIKMKKPGFSFPKFGFSKPETKSIEADVNLPHVDVSLPGENVKMEGPNKDIILSTGDTGEEDKMKFGSPTKFKLPTISLPKFGAKAPKAAVDISAVDVQTKDLEMNLPPADSRLSSDPLSIHITGPDIDKQGQSKNLNMTAQGIQIEGQESKFKLPKFAISFPEVKGPKTDLHAGKTVTDTSLPEGKGEMHAHDAEAQDVKTKVKIDLPEVDSKDLEVKMKKPGFSFPKFGFSKSELKAPEADMNLPHGDVSLPGENVKKEEQNMDISLSVGDTGLEEDETKFGSPTKFKLPSISLPKFGAKASKEAVDISAVDVKIQSSEIHIPQAEESMSAPPLSLNIKAPELQKEWKELNVDIKAEDMKTEGQESKIKLPKFGISLPEVKGLKIGLDISKTETALDGKREVHAPDIEVPDVKTEVILDLPKVDSKGPEVEIKKPGFSFPKFGFSKSETMATEGDLNVGGNVKMEEPNIDIAVSMGQAGQENTTNFGSPSKFKLPSISLPKFGAKVPKDSVDISAVDEITGPEISLPEVEVKEPLSFDIKMPEGDIEGKSVNITMKAQGIKIEGQESKFKLPKFGISLPEVKGPKTNIHAGYTETDTSLSSVCASDAEIPDLKSEMKVDLPEVDSKSLEVKMKKPGFSFPKFGFSKIETKVSEANVSVSHSDVSLPPENVKIEGPSADIKLSVGDSAEEDKIKFGSPTKLKLPTVSLPKFGAKATKETVEFSHVDVQMKSTEISLPDAEVRMPADPITVDVKRPDIDKQGKSLNVNIKAEDMKTEGQESKFKLPKFGISIPEVKGPKKVLNAGKTETDISLPKGKGEMHASDVEIPDLKTDMNVYLPEVDSKGLEVKMKRPGFSVPKFGSAKAETNTPEHDPRLLHFDSPLPEQSTQMEGTDIMLSMGDVAQKDEIKFDSPKFKLPSISLPKFKTKASKAATDISAVDGEIKRHEVSLPEADLKVSVDLKGSGVDKEGKSYNEMDIADINSGIKDHIKCQDSKVKAEIKEKQPPEATIKHDQGDKGSPIKFKHPTIKMPNISISKSQFQDGQDDAALCHNVLEHKHKEETQKQEKSSKFTMPKFADVLRGFDVEFNVPKLDEIEQANKETATPTKHEYVTGVKDEASAEGITTNKEGGAQEKSKLKFKFPKLLFSQTSDDGDKMVNSEAILENSEEQPEPQGDQKPDNEEQQTKPEKSGLFTLPKLSSPTPASDLKEKEAEKSSTGEVEEDTISPTLSLRSSEAFADISAPTTEQIGLSPASPTKIKVKYSEPTIEVSDLHGDVITSTTRTEVISMEPHQPEKVNIPFSSETSSSSLKTLKEMLGEVHVIMSNVQTVPDTQHATILTYLDSQVIQTLPPEEMTVKSGSVLLTETARVLKQEHTLVQKHVVEEMFGDGNEKVLMTSRIQVFEGGAAETTTDDTASSIQKLKDIVHTEKMRFFEGADSNETIVMGSDTSLRHADSSTDENEGK